MANATVLNSVAKISITPESFTGKPWSRSSMEVGEKSLLGSCENKEVLSPPGFVGEPVT